MTVQPTPTMIRGVEIDHEVVGPSSQADRSDWIVWGHGLTSSRAVEDERPMVDWSVVAEATARPVLRYDARGHGLSGSTPEPERYSWADLALDQLALADANGIDRYVAGGASMGCGTALHAAVAAPERVERLILAIPPTAWETRAGQVDQYEATAHVIATRGVEPVIAAGRLIAPPDPLVDDDGRLDRRAAHLRATDPERLARVFRGAGRADLPDRDAIAGIDRPVLILAWTGDPTHPMTTAEELHRLLPDSELAVATTPAELASWTDLVAGFLAG